MITPTVTAASAMLNAGHQEPTPIKSVTPPKRTRSIRLPTAPPRIKPMANKEGVAQDNGNNYQGNYSQGE